MLKRHLPNILTLSRMVAVPFMVWCMWLDTPIWHAVATALFVYAGLTDLVDGYLARSWGSVSALGRALDPIADKLLVVAALVMLLFHTPHIWLAALLIILREMLISGLRETMIEAHITIHVSTLAKYKTAIQMLGIFLLMLHLSAPELAYMSVAGTITLWIAAMLTVATGLQYVHKAVKALK